MILKIKNAKKVYLPDVVGKGYGSFWRWRGRYKVCKGSRASKKSKTTALYFIVNMMKYTDANLSHPTRGAWIEIVVIMSKSAAFAYLDTAMIDAGISGKQAEQHQPYAEEYVFFVSAQQAKKLFVEHIFLRGGS